MQPGGETEGSVRVALETGYRSLDTAAIYGNEESVGQAIRQSGVPRQDIFITTKVWNSDLGFEQTIKAFDVSRKKMDVDMIDLYLIHWPVKGRYVEAWRGLEKLYQDGLVRAIGVSNFLVHHLRDILAVCEIRPMLNQVEYHPLLRQPELHRFCIDNQIQLEAWAPLMQGQGMNHPLLVDIGAKHKKSPAQVLIRWDLQKEVVTIPKSITPHRILENSQVFDFELSAADMARIDALDEGKRIGADPDNFDF
jgi:diketogulonate reductase-like aldo/keto reductase